MTPLQYRSTAKWRPGGGPQRARPRLSLAPSARNPLATTVSESEPNDQSDCNLQHWEWRQLRRLHSTPRELRGGTDPPLRQTIKSPNLREPDRCIPQTKVCYHRKGVLRKGCTLARRAHAFSQFAQIRLVRGSAAWNGEETAPDPDRFQIRRPRLAEWGSLDRYQGVRLSSVWPPD